MGRKPKVDGIIAKRIFADLGASLDANLNDLLSLMFLNELSHEQQVNLAKILKRENTYRQIIHHLESGDFHAAEEVINNRLLISTTEGN